MHYLISLDAPTAEVSLAIQNLGPPLQDKDGVFIIHLWSEDGQQLKPDQYGLPISPRLGEPYKYVTATQTRGLIRLGTIRSTTAFTQIKATYVEFFTDRPMQPSHFGPLFYTVPDDRGPTDRVHTKMVRPMTSAAEAL